MAEHNSFFQINDIVLDIAPENIKINKSASIRQYKTLRARGTAKVRSSTSVTDITVQCKFVGTDAINTRLRPLVAQFKLTPFCYIENQFVRDSIIGDVNSKENIAFALQNLNISTIEDHPDTWNVVFSFILFNYKPYSKDFSFKKKLFDKSLINRSNSPGTTTDLENGLYPFALFYSKELEKLQPVSLLNSDIVFNSLEFILAETPPAGESTSFDIDYKALDQLRDDVSVYAERVKDFNTSNTDELDGLELHDFFNSTSTATANDLLIKVNQLAEQTRTEKPNDIRLERLLQDSKELIRKTSTVFKNKEWLEFPIVQDQTLNSFKEKDSNLEQKLYYRTRTLTSARGDFSSGIVATSININYTNKLAIIPIQGYQYPTAQFFGGDNFQFSVNFACLDDESQREFTSFWNSSQNALQYGKYLPQDLLSIQVENDLFKFFGTDLLLLAGQNTGTVLSNPGLYYQELIFVENEYSIRSAEQLVSTPVSNKKVRKLIWKAIWNNVSVKTFLARRGGVILLFEPKLIEKDDASEFFIKVILDKDPTKSHLEFNSVTDFLKGLNHYAEYLLTDILSSDTISLSGNSFKALDILSGITDDTIMGIEGLARHVYEGSERFVDPYNNMESIAILKPQNQYISSLLAKTEQQRLTDLESLRRADIIFKDAITNIKADGGLKTITSDLILETNNGGKVDLGSALQGTGLIEGIRSKFIDAINAKLDTFAPDIGYIPTTLESAFSQASENIARTLISVENNNLRDSLDVFQDWNKWAVEVADSIKDNYLHLAIFKEARDYLNKKDEASKTSLYQDMNFSAIKEQVLNIYGATGIDSTNIDLEPDLYFWNESIDNPNFNPLSEQNIREIKESTTKYYVQSWRDNTNWYQRKYLNKVDPEVRKLLQFSNEDKSDNLVFQESPTRIASGLTQITTDLFPKGSNNFIPRERGIDGIRSSLNAPIIAGQKVAIGKRSLNDFNKTVQIGSQPTQIEEHLSKAVDNCMSEDDETASSYGGWIHPLPGAQISSIIGYRSHPLSSIWKFHTGIDFKYDRINGQDRTTGMPIKAAQSGEVVKAREDGGFGNCIEIRSEISGDPDIPSGFIRHRYAHLYQMFVSQGDSVSAGQVIGLAGNTGDSTGPHLHFDIRSEEDPNIFIYPIDFNIDKVVEISPSTRTSGGYKILYRPQMIPIDGTVNPALPNTGLSSSYLKGLSAFELAAKEFDLSQRSISGYRMNRAYPTIYLAFIEEDMGDKAIYKFDDYFSFSSIVNFSAVLDREVPADYALMELTNISGNLSNRRHQQSDEFENDPIYKGKAAKDAERDDYTVINTDEEFKFESLMLREGIKVEVRLGYSNSPENNKVVFIGRITGVQFSESDDLVSVEMQSLATELVQDIKGQTTSDEYGGLFVSDAKTGPLLEELIASPECVSFGFWKRGDKDTNSNRELLTDRWTWNPSPSSDNIFAPPSEDLDTRKFFLGKSFLAKAAFGAASTVAISAIASAIFGGTLIGLSTAGVFGGAAFAKILEFKAPFSTLKYYLHQSTIWDVFKEMEHRHPDCISSPVPYVEKTNGRTRMTMFFGNPDWLYFARDPSSSENLQTEETRIRLKQLEDLMSLKYLDGDQKINVLNDLKDSLGLGDLATNKMIQALKTESSSEIEKQFEEIAGNVKQSLKDQAISNGAIKPFRNYHLVTSQQHIIANNIRAKSSNTFNAVTINYAKNGDDDVDIGEDNSPKITDMSDLTLKLDSNIPEEFVREAVYTYPNCQSDMMAKRYAASHLQKACWNIYQGELIILGNPTIKPYDIVFVYDQYSDMVGPVQVRRVTHSFDPENGFISIIVPDLVTTVTEGVMISDIHAMGLMAERYLFGFNSETVQGDSVTDTLYINPVAGLAAKSALNIASFFGAKKLLFVTQFGNPIRIHPLLKGGQPLVAGFGPSAVRENEFTINKAYEWILTRWKAASYAAEDFQNMFKNRQGIFNSRGKLNNVGEVLQQVLPNIGR